MKWLKKIVERLEDLLSVKDYIGLEYKATINLDVLIIAEKLKWKIS